MVYEVLKSSCIFRLTLAICLLFFILFLCFYASATLVDAQPTIDGLLTLEARVYDFNGSQLSGCDLTFTVNQSLIFEGVTDSKGLFNATLYVPNIHATFSLTKLKMVNHTLVSIDTHRYDNSPHLFHMGLADGNVTVEVYTSFILPVLDCSDTEKSLTLGFNMTVLRGGTCNVSLLDPYTGNNVASVVKAHWPCKRIEANTFFVPYGFPVNFSVIYQQQSYIVSAICLEGVSSLDLTASLVEQIALQRLNQSSPSLDLMRGCGMTVGLEEFNQIRNAYMQAVEAFEQGDVTDGVFWMQEAQKRHLNFDTLIQMAHLHGKITANFLEFIVAIVSITASYLLVDGLVRRFSLATALHVAICVFLALTQSSMRVTLIGWSTASLLKFVLLPFSLVYAFIFMATLLFGKAVTCVRLVITQLRRRRFRTTLTLLTVIFITMAVTLFSSVSLAGMLAEKPFTRPVTGPPGLVVSKNWFMWQNQMDQISSYEIDWFKSRVWAEDMGVYQQLKTAVSTYETPSLISIPRQGQIPEEHLGPGWILFSPDKGPLFGDFGCGFLGVSPSFMTKHYDVEKIIVNGSFLTDEDPHGIIISYEVAQEVGLNVGDMVELRDATFLVKVGPELYMPRWVETFWVRGLFNDTVVAELRDIDGSTLNKPVNVAMLRSFKIVVIACYTASVPYVFNKLTVVTSLEHESQVFNMANEIASTHEYNVVAVSGQNMRSYEFIETIKFIGWREVAILVILGSLIITNALFANVYERRRELAIFSEVGASPSDIRNMVATESLIISVLGAVIGYVLSFVFASIFGTFFSQILALGRISHFQEPSAIFLSLSAGVVMALVGSLLPIRKAITITVPSRVLKLGFQQLFERPDLEKTSTIPARFKPEHFPQIESFTEELIHRYRLDLFDKIQFWDAQKKRQPRWSSYKVQVKVRRDPIYTMFEMHLELRAGKDVVTIRLTLTPWIRHWGRNEKLCAKDLVKTLRREFLVLNEKIRRAERRATVESF